MRRTIGRGTGVAGLLSLVACTPALAQGGGMQGGGMRGMMMQAQDPAFVEVSANAEVSVPVDRGTIRFAVETQAPSAGEASTQNATKMDAVLAALRELGVEGLTLETSGYQLQPVYRRPDETGTREIAAYRALNHVVARTDEIDGLGRIIDAGVGAGANRVAGITFEATDTRAARLDALRQAVEKARAEAEVMAQALGTPLGEALEVRGGADRPRPVPMMARMEAAQAAPDTPIEPGSQTVSASVTVRFRLGEG